MIMHRLKPDLTFARLRAVKPYTKIALHTNPEPENPKP